MAMNGNPWQSMAIHGNHWRLALWTHVLRQQCIQRQFKAMNGNQRQSTATSINDNQRQSTTINGNQRQSTAINGNQRQSPADACAPTAARPQTYIRHS
jgi:hypothetical protein